MNEALGLGNSCWPVWQPCAESSENEINETAT